MNTDDLSRLEAYLYGDETENDMSINDLAVLIAGLRSERAELGQFRARLAALEPLAQAAVALYCNLDADADARGDFLEVANEFGANWIAAQARAQAQDGAA